MLIYKIHLMFSGCPFLPQYLVFVQWMQCFLLIFFRKYLCFFIFFLPVQPMFPPIFIYLYFLLFILACVISVRGFPQIFSDPGFMLIFKIGILKRCLGFFVHNTEVRRMSCREPCACVTRPNYGEIANASFLCVSG